MEPAEVALAIALAAVNLAAGIACAILIARLLVKLDGKPRWTFRHLAALLGVYFLECVAFPAGMATQVFSVGLAFVWGIAFGLWARSRATRRKGVRAAFYLSVYTCLPTLSFCVLLPVAWALQGGDVLSASEGIAFGIPSFLVWPVTTILGFCTVLALGTVALKTIITTGAVSLLFRSRAGLAT